MSGLVCAIRTGDEDLVKKMLKILVRKEPGEETVAVRNDMILGRAGRPLGRLTARPVDSADGSLTIAFCGRLYNAESLRPHLKPKPRDKSEGSVVLSLYKMKGRKCVHYMDGEFSFVMRDKEGFFAARDPLGVKQLYYARTDDKWLFASELKAFPKTYMSVSEFPPGCYWDSEAGARRYFKLPDEPAKQLSLQEASELVRVLVTEAVHKRLDAVGEVGAFLTGSVESCIVAAVAHRKNKQLKTFSVGLENTNDGSTARKVADWLGTDHQHREIKVQDILDALQQIIYQLESFDAPLVRRAVADYFAAQFASDTVAVLLSGGAADELFGGYAYLRPMFSEKLSSEIRSITSGLHRTQLQRWDRMTNVHGVEGRVPFADRRLVHAAFHLPPSMKVSDEGRSKWVLRRAFSTMLPAWVVDRPDPDDTNFVGIQAALMDYAHTVFTDEDIHSQKENEQQGLPQIRSKDELLYYQVWSGKFPMEYVPLVGRTHF
ncbi:MAG: hypothetical protein IH851_01905 [Armatimonadetes bacterium]|nr:hypothetical protein [Armatimonadota bacterium]